MVRDEVLVLSTTDNSLLKTKFIIDFVSPFIVKGSTPRTNALGLFFYTRSLSNEDNTSVLCFQISLSKCMSIEDEFLAGIVVEWFNSGRFEEFGMKVLIVWFGHALFIISTVIYSTIVDKILFEFSFISWKTH